MTDLPTQSIMHADDLKSVAGNLGSLQEQANLVSAFALVFGLDQSRTKFRAFRFPFDVPMDQRDRISPMEVADKYTELIWKGLPTVPNKDMIARDLQAALQDPPTEEEFRCALKDQKNSTTPGMSNVAYGNIKDWPDELITHSYQLLRVMWGARIISHRPGSRSGQYSLPNLRTRQTLTTCGPSA